MYQQIKILALSAVVAMSLGTGAVPKTITVFVYNYAATPSEVLVQTEAEAARIYQLGGIEIQWLNCPLSQQEVDQFPACQVAPGPTKLALRILSQSMAERVRQAEDSFGFAMFPEDGSFAIIANVFSHDAEALAHRRGMRHGLVLGHLVAHELGHLLLGAGSHSSQGIMHVPWGVKELDMIQRRSMVFTSREAERMRANIAARTAIAGLLGYSKTLPTLTQRIPALSLAQHQESPYAPTTVISPVKRRSQKKVLVSRLCLLISEPVKMTCHA